MINQDTVVASSLHDGSEINIGVRIVNLREKPRKFRKDDFITEGESVEICDDDSCQGDVGMLHDEDVDPVNTANMFSEMNPDAEKSPNGNSEIGRRHGTFTINVEKHWEIVV